MTSKTDLFEPVIVQDSVFVIRRQLSVDGDIDVHVGDKLDYSGQIARASMASGREVVVQVARELDIAPDAVERNLKKPIGSSISEGEILASARRGLRNVNCVSPISATISSVDPQIGSVILAPKSKDVSLQAVVSGEVENIIEDRGAVLRTTGSRVRGAIGFGPETYGEVKVAVDRGDRELTADAIGDDLKGAIVLAGMTISAAAVRRLSEVGARGVIVGSISDGEIRQLLTGSLQGSTPRQLWGRNPWSIEVGGRGDQPPLTFFVTEGFGRRRMTTPVFDFIAEREGETASILIHAGVDVLQSSPELYFTSLTATGDDAIRRVQPEYGVVARLTDPQHLGIVVTCKSGVLEDRRMNGVIQRVVDVEYANGTRRYAPLANLDIIR